MIKFNSAHLYDNKGNPNWLDEFAFLAENRPRIKDVSELSDSIIKEGKVLCTIEVIPFDVNDKECLLNGHAALVDLDRNPILQDDLHKVKYMVVDGMHRFYCVAQIARYNPEADVHVKIIVDKGLKRSHLWSMNSISSPWNNRDYVESYAKCGIGDYPALWNKIKELEEEYSWAEVIFYYSQEKGSSDAQATVPKLKYKIDLDKGDKLIRASRLFKNIPSMTKKYNTQNFVRNLREAYYDYPFTFNPDHLAEEVIHSGVNLFDKITEPTGEIRNPGKADIKSRIILNWFAYYDRMCGNDRNYTLEQKQIMFDRDKRKFKDGYRVKCLAGAHSLDEPDYVTFDKVSEWHGDHFITSWNDGGKTVISNGRLLGPKTNSSKGDKSAKEWLSELMEKALNIEP